jgi:hypothetical protein
VSLDAVDGRVALLAVHLAVGAGEEEAEDEATEDRDGGHGGVCSEGHRILRVEEAVSMRLAKSRSNCSRTFGP